MKNNNKLTLKQLQKELEALKQKKKVKTRYGMVLQLIFKMMLNLMIMLQVVH